MKQAYTLVITFLVSITTFAQTYTTYFKSYEEKKWGYVNMKGEEIIKPQFKKCFSFSEGYAPIYSSSRKTFYFVDLNGKELKTELDKFKIIEYFGFCNESFSSGLVAVIYQGKWGFLDKNGKLAITNKYTKVRNFRNGMAYAQIEKQHFLLNIKGEETKLSDEIINVKHFTEGIAPAQLKNKKYGFIDTTGTIVIPAKFVAVGHFSHGLAWAKSTNDKIGYINYKGEWVIKPQFSTGKQFDKKHGLARIKKDGKWAYVTTEGKIVNITISTLWDDFNNGLARGRAGDLIGFYGPDNTWLIKPQFEGARDFKNGYAAAKKNGKWGIINTKGEWVVQPKYATIKDVVISD